MGVEEPHNVSHHFTVSLEMNDLLELVTVVIVTHQSRHCLNSQNTLLSECPHVIIIDNASNDGTPEHAAMLWPHAKIIALEKNFGFGAANNRALEQIQTPWAFLLNPDCQTDADTLRKLLKTGEQLPNAAIIAPQLLNQNGKPEINYRWPSTEWKSRGPGAEAICCVGFICGAAMLLRTSLLPKPIFDEQFFLYYEDDDLCLRLFQQKYELIIQPDCHAIHWSRNSVLGNKIWRNEYTRGYHHAQSKLTFSKKHSKNNSTAALKFRLIASSVLMVLTFSLLLNRHLVARAAGRCIGALKWKSLQPPFQPTP